MNNIVKIIFIDKYESLYGYQMLIGNIYSDKYFKLY